MKDMVEFVEAIIRNVKISWSGKMIIIFLLALLFVGIWILCKYAKAKSTIKENFKKMQKSDVGSRGDFILCSCNWNLLLVQ